MRMKDRRLHKGIWNPVLTSLLPFLLFVAVRPSLALLYPPNELARSLPYWLLAATADLVFILPFALFATGVVLARKLGRSRRLFGAIATVGIAISAVSYVLGAWVQPVMTDRWLGAHAESVALGFTPRTPVGIARHLQFVEANPPEEYGLRNDAPHQWPPNVLRWELHARVAMVFFGLINVLLGVLAAELTVDLTRGRRRNVCLAVGLVGTIAFLLCFAGLSPGPAFARGWTMLPGIVAAWTPLAVPVAEALVLGYLVRRKMYG